MWRCMAVLAYMDISERCSCCMYMACLVPDKQDMTWEVYGMFPKPAGMPCTACLLAATTNYFSCRAMICSQIIPVFDDP